MTNAVDTNQKNSDLVVSLNGGGLNSKSTPFEVKLPANTGGFDDDVCEIKILASALGDAEIYNGAPHGPISVVVSCGYNDLEAFPNFPSTGNSLCLFRGYVVSARFNIDGNPNLVMLKCSTFKQVKLAAKMGFAANPQCFWTFREASTCKVVLTGLMSGAKAGPASAVISSITGKSIIVVYGPAFTAPVDKYFHRGYLNVKSVSIGIRDWNIASPTQFDLVSALPASWVGEAVTIFPGCDKTKESCIARWNNEERFGGFGYGIPNYNPGLEFPTGTA